MILTHLRTISALPRTLQKLVDVVDRHTGYPMVILRGGPQIKENGIIGTWQYVYSKVLSNHLIIDN